MAESERVSSFARSASNLALVGHSDVRPFLICLAVRKGMKLDLKRVRIRLTTCRRFRR